MSFDWKKMKLSKDSKIRKGLEGMKGLDTTATKKGKGKKESDFLSAFDEKIKKKNESLFG